jgi:hypothetical protein
VLLLADTDVFDEDEMFENWRRISELLKRRCMRARRAHDADTDNVKKAQAFLLAAKEYHAFAFLLRQYGNVSKKLIEVLEGHAEEEAEVEPVESKTRPEDLN